VIAPAQQSLAPRSIPSAASEGRPYRFTVVELDFQNKREQIIDVERIQSSIQSGRFVWIDADVCDLPESKQALLGLGLIAPEVIDGALHSDPATMHARYDEYIHLVVSGCRAQGVKFALERVDVVLAESFLITVHKGPVVFLSAVKRDYRNDFLRYARSPSFMLYEIWDHLLENYLVIQKGFEERVEQLQAQLRGDKVDDAVFARVSELGADLLHFRKILLPARAVLTDLSTRRTIFISEATQPFLHNMVGTVEHVLQDLLVDRDILSESVNLYMSLVSHRTNAVMKRLTVVSVVFMPLTFLVGIYGMNFESMPELKWPLGYLFFWSLAALLVLAILWLLKRTRLL
jgi:magnesium transporter